MYGRGLGPHIDRILGKKSEFNTSYYTLLYFTYVKVNSYLKVNSYFQVALCGT